jgi:tRNA (cmo5U34)-methyltransferase
VNGERTFDSVASFYPMLEQIVFGSILRQSRQLFAERLLPGKNILLIGEGNGRFLLEMAKETSAASFTVVDSSARMLAAAARRMATIDRPGIKFVQADILDWESPEAQYDLVVTHFFLDLFAPSQIRRIVEKISQLATEDALWINTDFTSEYRGLRQRFLMWAQYRFFRIAAGIEASRLYDPLPYLREAGWHVLERRSLESGWISADLMCTGRR